MKIIINALVLLVSFASFGQLSHPSGYFTMGPYSSSYDDGTHAKLFYDGNNRRIQFWNSDNNTYTGINVGNVITSGVGINSSQLKGSLHVNGDYYGKGHFQLYAYEGDGVSGTAYLQARDDSGTSNIDLQFRTQQSGSINNLMKLTYDGKIGIGNTSPQSTLHINGNEQISGASTDLPLLKLENGAWACNQRTSIEFWNGGLKNHPTSRIVSQMDGCGTQGEALLFETQTAGETTPTSKMVIKNNGNIGIGITNPTQKLQVAGTVYSTEVKVELAAGQGPDYVFEPDYELRTLKETKEYITENKHLPEIPSASEMEADGIDLGDMNMRLLKKIEELTLYQIELMERLEKLETENNRIDELEKQIEQLKKN